MAQLLSRDEVVERLRRHIAKAGYFGAQVDFARTAGVQHSRVSNVFSGREDPCVRIQAALGVRRVVVYEVVGEPLPIQLRARSRGVRKQRHEPRVVVHRIAP